MFEQESKSLEVILGHIDLAFKKGAFGLNEASAIVDHSRVLLKFHEEGVVEVANRVLAGIEANQSSGPEQTYSAQPEPQLAQPPITETPPPTVNAPHVENAESEIEEVVAKQGKPKGR